MATLTAARNDRFDMQDRFGDIVGFTRHGTTFDDATKHSTMTQDEWFCRLAESLGHSRDDIEIAISDEKIDAIPD